MSRGHKAVLGAVFLVSLAWALIASHGVQLWDDDFAGWFRYALPKSIPRLIWEWLSPVPARTDGFAFQNRPAQAFFYKIIYVSFGYRAAVYFAIKSVFWAGLATLNSFWVLRWGKSRVAALLPPLILLSSPSVMASFIWHADYGLLAECALSGGLILGFRILEEKSPDILWQSIIGFVVIYLGYGTKAHAKCIPLILLAYQATIHPKEKRGYFLPLSLLIFAIPWSRRLLGETAPWWPTSAGSPIRWMTQPWSAPRLFAHWMSGLSFWPRQFPHSLSEELGPSVMALCVVVGAALVWHRRMEAPLKRALWLVLLWLGAVSMVLGALPDLPPFFSVRYGLILLSPTSILAGLALAHLLSLPWRAYFLPLAAPLGATLWCNGALAVEYRDSLGSLTRAVDAAYSYVEAETDRAPLLLLPRFLDFDYRPDSPLHQRKRTVGSLAEAVRAAPSWALSWEPIFDEQLGLARIFDGCAGFALRPDGCAMRAHLYRLPATPDAPSLMARFRDGLAAANAGDSAGFLTSFQALARDAPTVQVRYNYALALQRNRRFDEALGQWKRLVREGVRDRGTLLNALESARSAGDHGFQTEVESLLQSR